MMPFHNLQTCFYTSLVPIAGDFNHPRSCPVKDRVHSATNTKKNNDADKNEALKRSATLEGAMLKRDDVWHDKTMKKTHNLVKKS